MTTVEIAESFHLAFLQALATRANQSAWALKGGGNLRFFYGSERFSEDIDLDTFDIEPWAFQDRVNQTLASDLLKRTLGLLGSRIDYLNPTERSTTKSTWVVGVRQPSETAPVYTQIEVSHREYPYREFAKVEPVTGVPQLERERVPMTRSTRVGGIGQPVTVAGATCGVATRT